MFSENSSPPFSSFFIIILLFVGCRWAMSVAQSAVGLLAAALSPGVAVPHWGAGKKTEDEEEDFLFFLSTLLGPQSILGARGCRRRLACSLPFSPLILGGYEPGLQWFPAGGCVGFVALPLGGGLKEISLSPLSSLCPSWTMSTIDPHAASAVPSAHCPFLKNMEEGGEEKRAGQRSCCLPHGLKVGRELSAVGLGGDCGLWSGAGARRVLRVERGTRRGIFFFFFFFLLLGLLFFALRSLAPGWPVHSATQIFAHRPFFFFFSWSE